MQPEITSLLNSLNALLDDSLPLSKVTSEFNILVPSIRKLNLKIQAKESRYYYLEKKLNFILGKKNKAKSDQATLRKNKKNFLKAIKRGGELYQVKTDSSRFLYEDGIITGWLKKTERERLIYLLIENYNLQKLKHEEIIYRQTCKVQWQSNTTGRDEEHN